MKIYWSGSIALNIVREIIKLSPRPKIKTDVAKLCAEAIGLHMIMLILAASDANLKGRHSSAIFMFRGMEDALDCFAAVSLIPGAADKWVEGKLKASEAAKLWEPELGEITLPNGEKAIEYRKNLRNYFNAFTHCTPYLTDWNAYPCFTANNLPDSHLNAQLYLNHQMTVLEQNAIRIGAFLTAHLLEFIRVIEMVYSQFLDKNKDLKNSLGKSARDLEKQLKDNFGAVYLEEMPPEIKEPVIKCANGKYRKMHFINPQASQNRRQKGKVNNSGS